MGSMTRGLRQTEGEIVMEEEVGMLRGARKKKARRKLIFLK